MDYVSLKEAKQLIIDCFTVGIVPMLWSSPGVGKSDLMKQIAKEHGLFLIDYRLAQMDPTDLNGFPWMDKVSMRSHYAPPMNIPLEGDPIPEGYKGWLLLFDEITSAAPTMQAAAYKPILDRLIGDHKIHPNAVIAAAGNMATDRAVVHRMSTALQSRMAHIVIRVDEPDWLEHALKYEFDYRVIGFLRFRGELLHKFDPKHNDLTYSCPRTWEFASKLLKQYNSLTPQRLSLLKGVVGEGPALELKGFVDVCEDMPQKEQIEKNPLTAIVPTEPSGLYAVSSMMVYCVDASNYAVMMQYAERLPLEFQTIMLSALWKKKPPLQELAPSIAWLSKNAKEFL